MVFQHIIIFVKVKLPSSYKVPAKEPMFLEKLGEGEGQTNLKWNIWFVIGLPAAPPPLSRPFIFLAKYL